MFNADYKKEAVKKLEATVEDYKRVYNTTIAKSSDLYNEKEIAVNVIKEAEDYMNSISHKSIELEKDIAEVKFNREAFENEVIAIKKEKAFDELEKGIMGAGLLAGAGIASFGPSVAMGIATTFGTASTGTAIAALSGIAQTNAALAWLGGGALVAGGSGMVGGEALLALAGPLGWAIGGAALVGGGFLASSKNRKIAEKAETQMNEVKNEMNKLNKMIVQILDEKWVIGDLSKQVHEATMKIRLIGKNDYTLLSRDEKNDLRRLVNCSKSLSARVSKKLGQETKIVRG